MPACSITLVARLGWAAATAASFSLGAAGVSAVGWETECTDHGAALFAAAFYSTAFREEPRGSCFHSATRLSTSVSAAAP